MVKSYSQECDGKKFLTRVTLKSAMVKSYTQKCLIISVAESYSQECLLYSMTQLSHSLD